jgi:hypothetical protein
MLDQLLEQCTAYVTSDSTKTALQQRVLKPALDYVQDECSWLVRLLHGIAGLLVLQAVLLGVVIWLVATRALGAGSSPRVIS